MRGLRLEIKDWRKSHRVRAVAEVIEPEAMGPGIQNKSTITRNTARTKLMCRDVVTTER